MAITTALTLAHTLQVAALIVSLAGLMRPALAETGALPGASHGVTAATADSFSGVASSLHLSLGPLSRRGIEVGTLLSAEPGRERLYAYVDLQDRLPLPVRGVLRRADGGITVEREGWAAPAGAFTAPESRQPTRASLGSMLRWQVRGGTQMALKIRGAGRFGLQLTTPLSL